MMSPIVIIGIVGISILSITLIYSTIDHQQDLEEITVNKHHLMLKMLSESVSVNGVGTSKGDIELYNTSNDDTKIIQIRVYDGIGDFTKSFDVSEIVLGNSEKLITDLPLELKEMLVQFGYSFVGVTSNGVEFPISSVSTGNGTGDGESMIDGMGINSRIIQKDYDGHITYGIGNIGQDVSIIPYVTVNDSTDFTSLVEDGDTLETYVIPKFWTEYKFEKNILNDVSTFENILGYSENRDLDCSNSITTNDQGITISGDCKSILKLLDYSSSEILLIGDLPNGSKVKLVIADNVDFMTADYGTYGFTVPTSFPAIVGDDTTHYGTASWSSGYTYRSQSCALGSTGYYYASTSYTDYSSTSLVSATLTETDEENYHSITGMSGWSAITPADTGNPVWSWCQVWLNNGIQNGWVSGVTLALYDFLPAYTELSYDESFVEDYIFSSDQTYLYVEPKGEIITISGESITDIPVLKITNLDSNIPFQIIKEGLPIITGMTSKTGEILIDDIDSESFVNSGLLYLYPDSLSYRGAFSTVVFDNLNHETIHIDTDEDLVYTVHAYVKIPVIGNVEITDTIIHGTNGDVRLDYLNGNYTTGNEIEVPIIPRFNSVSMKINNVETQLDFSNVLGGTGIKIANSDSSTIKKSDLDNRITSMESIVGTTAYVIATSDGTINALVSETISGSVTITNNYQLEEIPPTPPTPPRRDPLSGWVDVYVNGEKIGDSISLGVNPYPDFTANSGLSGTSAFQSVSYSYPDYVVMGSVIIDVDAGDFVEFYLYAKIHGDIDGYVTPSGFTIISESGYGVATVNIKSASIQTSMS